MAKSNKLSKSHKDYWRNRVAKLGYKDIRTGKKVYARDYSVRIAHKKRREIFPLHTSNQKVAGDEASRIYSYLIINGWDLTLDKFKGTEEQVAEISTVGDLIKCAKRMSSVSPMTFRQYAGALRRVVSSAKGFNSKDKKRFRPDVDGNDKWQAKIDSVKLESITSDLIISWRNQELDGLNPSDRRSRQTTINSTLNQARSLWKYCDFPNPFKDLKWKQTTKRFKPQIDASALLFLAKDELEKDYFEQYKALTLCLFLGLRRSEADCLTWDQVDFSTQKVTIDNTDYFKPKSEDAIREIPIPRSLFENIDYWKSISDEIFVLSGGLAKPNCSYDYYRANATWKPLLKWLRSKGLEAKKPLHDVRKLAGSLMYENHDIYAAQRFLGHSDIRTTISSYIHEGEKSFDIIPERPRPKLVS